ncbi:MAG: hypothetical protein A9183_03000 [Dehalococcoides mccartyi]|uniref:hypothetical protein n=1 Tax=Dehalococcoides mccartyi TaxID=61435 RepID=UPI00080572A4|nr:hypothetical protein [Dehalococcoides mccartyi]OBW61086.1 MAG: hypothetical protein A9183_03000 [Dehalococcoides mccartyi]
MGITDPTEKQRVAALVKARDFGAIPLEHYIRLGDNPNGIWAGDDDAYVSHPASIEAQRMVAVKDAEAAKKVNIHLSTRGWGDYSLCEGVGDITRPDAEILAECRNLLATEHDVDNPRQSDARLLDKIKAARKAWATAPERKAAAEKAESEDIQRKITTGYCYSCESYCYGDCGHYSNDPKIRYHRQMSEATRESNYGINEGAEIE